MGFNSGFKGLNYSLLEFTILTHWRTLITSHTHAI